MCYVALPEASHIATYVTRYALAVGESWLPAQRPVPEDPAGGDILVIIIGRPILLIVVVVVVIVIAIVTAIAVAVVVCAQFAIDEQILEMSRHLTSSLLPAIVCHFFCFGCA